MRLSSELHVCLSFITFTGSGGREEVRGGDRMKTGRRGRKGRRAGWEGEEEPTGRETQGGTGSSIRVHPPWERRSSADWRRSEEKPWDEGWAEQLGATVWRRGPGLHREHQRDPYQPGRHDHIIQDYKETQNNHKETQNNYEETRNNYKETQNNKQKPSARLFRDQRTSDEYFTADSGRSALPWRLTRLRCVPVTSFTIRRSLLSSPLLPSPLNLWNWAIQINWIELNYKNKWQHS